MKCDPEDLNLAKLASDYNTPAKARAWLEGQLWPNGPRCPHCGSVEAYRITGGKKSANPARAGLCKCKACQKQFTVTVGTIFEDSHVPLNKWLMAVLLICSSKKGMSAHQLHRMLGVTYKTAWFMAHRLRFAMDTGPIADLLKGIVEVDETYVGGKPRPKHGDTAPQKRGRTHGEASKKTPVVALVQRDGTVRTKVVVNVNAKNLAQYLDANICKSSTVNTDQFALYKNLLWDWKRHDMVNHSAKEYARTNADGSVSHVNTAESFFSLIKRGVYGSFHHVSREHLHRYCHEFSFRWNHRRLTDGERMEAAIGMTEGKRLTYRNTV